MFPFALFYLCSVVLPIFATPLAPAQDATSLARRAATVYSRCTTPNTVALTFDDGPWDNLVSIVNQLDAENVKGTFFFNGNNYDCIYNADAMARVKYAYNRGHMIGSHTWSHANLATLTWDQIHNEMWRVEQALVRITGASPAFMRPPYGSYNDMVLEVSGLRKQGVVMWDFDSQDSLGASPGTSKNLYDGAINPHPNTLLTLNHETIASTSQQVLPYILPKLKAAGYSIVTVAECLGLPAYQSVSSPQTPDSSWTC